METEMKLSEKIFLALALIIIATSVFTGCMTTPDGRVTVDPVLLAQSLEALDMVLERIDEWRSEADDPEVTPAERQAEWARLELQRELLLTVIQALQRNTNIDPELKVRVEGAITEIQEK